MQRLLNAAQAVLKLPRVARVFSEAERNPLTRTPPPVVELRGEALGTSDAHTVLRVEPAVLKLAAMAPQIRFYTPPGASTSAAWR